MIALADSTQSRNRLAFGVQAMSEKDDEDLASVLLRLIVDTEPGLVSAIFERTATEMREEGYSEAEIQTMLDETCAELGIDRSKVP